MAEQLNSLFRNLVNKKNKGKQYCTDDEFEVSLLGAW